MDPRNLSALYFGPTANNSNSCSSSCDHDAFVGPIAIVQNNQSSCSSSSELKGRRLTVTRTVAAGELLFVTPPTVHASVPDVLEHWKKQQQTTTDQKTIAVASEAVLVQACRRAVKNRNIGVVNSIASLEGAGSTTSEPSSAPHTGMDRMLGKDETPNSAALVTLTDDQIIQVVRRNAFGPDFVTNQVIERRWRQAQETNHKVFLPSRVLGLYPLAAMINHSCMANAVRVYVGETMVVHACQTIPKGNEIVWSYIPVVQSGRRTLLQKSHGFICHCERCDAEEKLMLLDLTEDDDSLTVSKLEHEILPKLPSSVQRYIRVCYLNVYLDYLNASKVENKEELLTLCTQLHFSLASCHNASTEHLSILHLCYELIAALHTRAAAAGNGDSTMGKVRFWTDQLKRAVLTRYGALGDDVNAVRRMMKHTRTVLRQQEGIYVAEHPFI